MEELLNLCSLWFNIINPLAIYSEEKHIVTHWILARTLQSLFLDLLTYKWLHDMYWVPTGQALCQVLGTQGTFCSQLLDRPTVWDRNAKTCPPPLFQTWGLQNLGKWCFLSAQGYQGPRRNRMVPPLLCECAFYSLFHALLPLDNLSPDNECVFFFSGSGLRSPGVVCLNFSDSPMPLMKGSTFQLSSVSQKGAYLQARPGGTQQPARISPLLSHQLLPATQHLS